MFGISGVALGAILRAKNKTFGELAKVGAVFAVFIALLSFAVTMIPGLSQLTQFILGEAGVIGQFLNDTILADLTGFTFSLVTAVVGAVVGMLSLLIGGVVYDIAESIIK